MKIDILTIFPQMFKGPFSESILKRALDKKIVKINIHNLRKWTKDTHKTVDGRPYGGGPGMIFMLEPIDKALKELKKKNTKVILLTPQGKKFNQKKAFQLSLEKHLILICPHYEGIDERVRENFVDEEISIGDYILTGAELPTMILADAIVRLIPGVLINSKALKEESFNKNLLEYPQYTRPADFKGLKVPEILLSGNHKEIEKWRKNKALKRTEKRRPDLIK
ncbi:tRNA (guanosine(37)-N1)-methyltransferase TrmD [Candidatus Beckwithbacteria bacterium CG10_big_fil_rev_8_21_14_0_10_34_10]|uniref:tRNA (guanine-N(1)-)-methyltransferase n=1 Tax=Candidatus Beckwithbacteria bacterium CG10_big_fil_rev_8_21_14_0_10_34_10 TaxID=1974495 RepID=A0A2H0W9V7_9BACT|nr:MAG: tRNA (guanosine(37)-N1)-methyltransferase TrmD [Candidatus Beckwithbacteria bacterium CG10_big_fil_rev_8_21_14_0_10_34_10]